MLRPEIADSTAQILIVDDELENRRLMEIMLAAEGLQVMTVASGEAALAVTSRQPVDLIILDVMMTGMDGYEVASRVKGNAATQSIPIIMVTCLDDRDSRMRGLRAGAEDFLTKPVDRVELTLRVRNLLRLKAYGDAYDSYSQILEAGVSSRTAELVEQQQTLQRQAVVLAEQAALLGQHATALAAALQKAELASHAKDRLLMNVSHELRTPLNTILGWADILMTRRDQPVLERALPVIKRNALAQVHVVDQLLDVASLDSGRVQLELRPTDLRPIVQDAIELVRPVATLKQITIRSTGDATPIIVLGDGVRLRQVMRNLLSNAVKFTPEGGTVRVRANVLAGRLRLEVSDSGIGLDAGVLSQVFEHFFQADKSSTREYGGLGLGLTIVRELVEMQGGTVRASSEGPARGASFVIELPVHHAPPDDVAAACADGGAEARLSLS